MSGVCFLKSIQARQLGLISSQEYRARAEAKVPGVAAELERVNSDIFLDHLHVALGDGEFKALIERVTFGEVIASAQLVKRLIVREFTFLTQLSQYPQSAGWRETVAPFIGAPAPATRSVDEYLAVCRWSSVPFTRLPRPAYVHPEHDGGMGQFYLIVLLHKVIDAAVIAVTA